MRCLVMTLNAAVDTTYVLDTLRRGEVNRSLRTIALPGGKGNNVARVISFFGHEVISTGFIGGHAGEFIKQGLEEGGIETSFLAVPGESRRCLTFIEQEHHVVSEVHEAGVNVPAARAGDMLAHARALAQQADIAVISGSLPLGLEPDYYGRLVAAIRAESVPVAFDSSGEPLRLGLSAGPDFVKPNAAELRALAGRDYSNDELITFARRDILGSILGADATILLSLGPDGAALISSDSVLTASAPSLEVVNPVGAGDAMLAGFLHAWSRQERDEQMLRQAVATGCAATLQETAGVVDGADIERIRLEVEVRRRRR